MEDSKSAMKLATYSRITHAPAGSENRKRDRTKIEAKVQFLIDERIDETNP